MLMGAQSGMNVSFKNYLLRLVQLRQIQDQEPARRATRREIVPSERLKRWEELVIVAGRILLAFHVYILRCEF